MAAIGKEPSRKRPAGALWWQPNISVLGYAIYLAITATSLWGGVFPFFPDEFRTAQVTCSFAISQAFSFLAVFLVGMVASYWGMRASVCFLPICSAVVSFIGSGLLIAALYWGDLQIALVVLAGILLGAGSAGFALLWQRYFSSLSSTYGNYYLLLATAFGTVVFLVLYLVPIAVTVYLVPLILIPLCGLCGVLAERSIDLDQPLFEDVPCEHERPYRQMLQDYWRSALAVGSLGFMSGLIRSTLLSDASLGNIIIVISMIGALLASLALLFVWHRGNFALDMRSVFLVLFPLAALGLLAFPFLDAAATPWLSGGVYTIFTFAFLVMLLQCMQISRDRGMNPLFVFGFFGSIVYFMQDVGLTLGYAANMATLFGQEFFSVASLTGMFVLAIALYFLRGDVRLQPTVHAVEEVEFISQPQQFLEEAGGIAAVSGAGAAGRQEAFEKPGEDEAADAPEGLPELGRQDPGEQQSDAIALRCQELQEQYLLTNRETEIMELFAHGYTMPHIAELLVVSENTVRTHSKNLYAKLGIHKRQELIELLRS